MVGDPVDTLWDLSVSHQDFHDLVLLVVLLVLFIVNVCVWYQFSDEYRVMYFRSVVRFFPLRGPG